jgi:hypothetical protein
MNSASSLTFLGTYWSLGASVVVVVAVAGLGWFAWRRSGYRPAYGAVELLRLLIVLMAVTIFNQPEWVEEFRPEAKPAIAILWDDSRSMETQDVAVS